MNDRYRTRNKAVVSLEALDERIVPASTGVSLGTSAPAFTFIPSQTAASGQFSNTNAVGQFGLTPRSIASANGLVGPNARFNNLAINALRSGSAARFNSPVFNRPFLSPFTFNNLNSFFSARSATFGVNNLNGVGGLTGTNLSNTSNALTGVTNSNLSNLNTLGRSVVSLGVSNARIGVSNPIGTIQNNNARFGTGVNNTVSSLSSLGASAPGSTTISGPQLLGLLGLGGLSNPSSGLITGGTTSMTAGFSSGMTSSML